MTWVSWVGYVMSCAGWLAIGILVGKRAAGWVREPFDVHPLDGTARDQPAAAPPLDEQAPARHSATPGRGQARRSPLSAARQIGRWR